MLEFEHQNVLIVNMLSIRLSDHLIFFSVRLIKHVIKVWSVRFKRSYVMKRYNMVDFELIWQLKEFSAAAKEISGSK